MKTEASVHNLSRWLRGALGSFLLLMIFFLSGVQEAGAQRRVTPVNPDTPVKTTPSRSKKTPPESLVETTDINGNKILVDTISGTEYRDSTLLLAGPPPMEYPLIYAATVGVNVWDPLMRIFGQHYGLADFWAELNMHNRYFPYFAVGLGNCNDTPDDSNFTFKTSAAPYFKLGASYNFLYNSNPDYKLQIGLRYGFTSYKWSVENITVDEGYWDDPSHFSITDRHSTAGYLELTFGLKVRIAGNWSLGWNVVYHSILHQTNDPLGEPMYIPGYGKRGSALTGNFSIMYTLPLNKKKTRETVTPADALQNP